MAKNNPIVWMLEQYVAGFTLFRGYDIYKSVDGGRTFTKIVNLRKDVLKVIP